MEKSKVTLPPEIAGLSFEEALIELEKLVKQLEDGKAKLDDAINVYERAALLKKHCESKLREAKARIEKISVAGNSDGGVSSEPFNV